MQCEPSAKRAIAFIDGQNLFKAAEEAFDVEYPNFDPTLLSLHICELHGWNLREVRFYTGSPPIDRDPFWHTFWAKKLAQMGKQGVVVFNRQLRYQKREIRFGHGGSIEAEIPVEKGIDVRIAIDVIRSALRDTFDVAVLFSQDQDLSEAVDEVKLIGTEHDRWIQVASAFPTSPKRQKSASRGINKTKWIPFDRALYDRCLDRRDYRPPRKL
jgi:uncharacterized LabA/DUF88 family protein